MTKKALYLAGVLAASCVGAACAQVTKKPPGYGLASVPQVSTTAMVCTQSPCVHAVKVVVEGKSCTITVDPQIMYVKRYPAKVVWKLDAPKEFRIDFKFKDEDKAYLAEYNTYLKRVATPSMKQFHNTHVLGDGRSVETDDENTLDGSWYYNIRVKGGAIECSIDPPIINGF